MIPLLAGSRWTYEEDTYLLADPTTKVTITYRERVRQLARASSILRSVMASDPAVRWDPLGPIERLVTNEGEHAAFTVLRGLRGDAAVMAVVAIVFGDDFYALVVGRAPSENERIVEQVRALALADTHSLGVRRRRYEVTPPPGWGGFAMLFHAIYLHPRFPLDRGVITVFPALPRPPGSLDGPITFAALHATPNLGFEVGEQTAAIAIQAGNLTGTQYELRGSAGEQPGTRLLAIFEDERYLYPLALDTTAPVDRAHRTTFEDMARSVVAVPAPRSGAPVHSGLAELWSE